jgi:hypothetical protein
MDIERARIAGIIGMPDLADQVLAGKQFSRAAHKKLEQAGLLGSQSRLLPLAADSPLCEIKPNRPGAEHKPLIARD